MTKRTKLVLTLAIIVFAVMTVMYLFQSECAFGGGMPGWYRDCTCNGIELLDYDQTEADGHRRTTCIGLVTARKCFQYQGGPIIECSLIPQR